MKKTTIKTKQGAASMYTVVFTTMLLTIICLSFVRIIMSEVTNTINDELSQSAYDSALAGIEDAKLAVIKYHNCLGMDSDDRRENNCSAIENYMNSSNYDNCGAIPEILGRTHTNGEVLITEKNSSVSGEMLQAYTCVTATEKLPDYRSYLSATDTIRIIPLISNKIDEVTAIRVNWYSDSDGTTYNFANVDNAGKVSFGKTDSISTPPTIAVQLIQTDRRFNLSDFDYTKTKDNSTNRGTLWLTPSKNNDTGATNYINSKNGFLKSNNKATRNSAFKIKCATGASEGMEFACSTVISLPKPVDSNSDSEFFRNSESSYLVLTLPYGQPASDFSVELCTDSDGNCEPSGTETKENIIAYFNGAQAAVDSTGRANDIYRRVESRIELVDIYFPFPEFELFLISDDNALTKSFWTTQNCWTADNGSIGSCNNSGSI